MSALEQQAVLAKQLADVTPAVRFCQYQLSRAGGARPGPAGEAAEPQPISDALQVMLCLGARCKPWACIWCSTCVHHADCHACAGKAGVAGSCA